jgi:hypothetical protein
MKKLSPKLSYLKLNDVIPREFYDIRLEFFNNQFTHVNCLKLSLFSRKLAYNFEKANNAEKLDLSQCKNTFKKEQEKESLTYRKLQMKYDLFTAFYEQEITGEFTTNIPVDTTLLINHYKKYNETDELGVGSILNIHRARFVKENPITYTTYATVENGGLPFRIHKDLLKHSSTVLEVLVFSLMSNRAPVENKLVWTVAYLTTVLDDWKCKGLISIEYNRNILNRIFNKFNSFISNNTQCMLCANISKAEFVKLNDTEIGYLNEYLKSKRDGCA